jgi:hypothetical protein
VNEVAARSIIVDYDDIYKRKWNELRLIEVLMIQN